MSVSNFKTDRKSGSRVNGTVVKETVFEMVWVCIEKRLGYRRG